MYILQKKQSLPDNSIRLVLLVLAILIVVQALVIALVLSGNPQTPLPARLEPCDEFKHPELSGHCLPVTFTTPYFEV